MLDPGNLVTNNNNGGSLADAISKHVINNDFLVLESRNKKPILPLLID